MGNLQVTGSTFSRFLYKFQPLLNMFLNCNIINKICSACCNILMHRQYEDWQIISYDIIANLVLQQIVSNVSYKLKPEDIICYSLFFHSDTWWPRCSLLSGIEELSMEPQLPIVEGTNSMIALTQRAFHIKEGCRAGKLWPWVGYQNSP